MTGRLAGDGYLVSVQNGLNTAVLSDAVGPERVVEACVNFGADMLEPGVVQRGNRATFMVGELDGTITPRVTEPRRRPGRCAGDREHPRVRVG